MAKQPGSDSSRNRGLLGWMHARFIQPMLSVQTSLHSVSLGVSLGLFVGLTPTVGIQMIVVVVIGTLIKANRIVAVAWVWISNPVTMIPMYYGYYWLGSKVLGWELLGYSDFAGKLETFGREGFVAALGELWDLGTVIFEPLIIGSLLLATAGAIFGYPLTYVLLRRYFRKRDAEAVRLAADSEGSPRGIVER
ncbi:MAG: DUF2062 domain-containing protein [Planctomycetota bacterium]